MRFHELKMLVCCGAISSIDVEPVSEERSNWMVFVKLHNFGFSDDKGGYVRSPHGDPMLFETLDEVYRFLESVAVSRFSIVSRK
jgi:hypothetical protein